MSAPARALLKTKARREKVDFEKEGACCHFISKFTSRKAKTCLTMTKKIERAFLA